MDDDWNSEDMLEESEQNIVHRPLFEDLTEAHYRESAVDGPYGFLVGGMGCSSKNDLAIQYFEAANHLLERIRQYEAEDFTLTNPVLFLYRHSIEMLLKSRLIDPPKRHDLDGLIDAFVIMIKAKFDEDVPIWIIDRIKELALIDPASTAFRYGETYNRSLKDNVPVDGELHVDMNHLQETMRALHQALGNVPPADDSGFMRMSR